MKSWESDGCTIENTTYDTITKSAIFITCACTHLSEFAVELTTEPTKVEPPSWFKENAGNIVLGGLAMIFAISAIVLYVYSKKKPQKPEQPKPKDGPKPPEKIVVAQPKPSKP